MHSLSWYMPLYKPPDNRACGTAHHFHIHCNWLLAAMPMTGRSGHMLSRLMHEHQVESLYWFGMGRRMMVLPLNY